MICFSSMCGMCVFCPVFFGLPIGVIGRLWSEIVTLSGHVYY